MSAFHFIREVFRITDFRPDARRDIRDEIDFHLDMAAAEIEQNGCGRNQAREQARNLLGDRSRIESECEQIATLDLARRRRLNMNDTLSREIRTAVHSFLARPLWSGIIILMMALGIAGNTAVFSLINGLFITPLPYPEEERLFEINETAPEWDADRLQITYPDFVAWRENNRTFESMGVYHNWFATMLDGDEPSRVPIVKTSWDLPRTLQVAPLAGRLFTPGDDIPGAPGAVLLLEGFWAERFGRDPDAVGRTLILDGEACEVIGILPAEAALTANGDLWLPLRRDPLARDAYFMHGIGRLQSGVTPEQAEEDLRAIQQGLIDQGITYAEVMPTVLDLREKLFGDLSTALLLVWIAVGVLLLIACANIASLTLARAFARSREFAIRTTLGAGRGAIVRQLTVEAMILSLFGGVIGVLMGIAIVRIVTSMFAFELPGWITFGVDLHVILFSLLCCTIAALVFGLVPAVQLSRRSRTGIVAGDTARSTPGLRRRFLLKGFVVAEIALTLVMIITTALLLQTFLKINRIEPGFDPEGVLTFSLALPDDGSVSWTEMVLFFTSVSERLESIPGVDRAAACYPLPLGGHMGYFFEAEDSPLSESDDPPPVSLGRTVTPGYADALGLELLSGRFLQENETVFTIVVNESFARLYWGEEDPIGRRTRFRGAEWWFEVVGVVRDIRHYGLDQEMIPGAYFPLGASPINLMSFALKTSGDPLSLVDGVRAAVAEIDPHLPAADLSTMQEQLTDSLAFRRAYSILIGVFTLMSLLLALGGVYGVISHSVGLRTREIGVRMALGARRPQMIRMVLGEGFRLVAVGSLLGLGLSLAASGLLSGLLFEVEAVNLPTLIGAVLALGAVALGANLIPAHRAARIHPVIALRQE